MPITAKAMLLLMASNPLDALFVDSYRRLFAEGPLKGHWLPKPSPAVHARMEAVDKELEALDKWFERSLLDDINHDEEQIRSLKP
jgi:hypothetical protein